MIDLGPARANAEKILLDTITFLRAGGPAIFNRDTMAFTNLGSPAVFNPATSTFDAVPDSVTIWTGPCSLTYMGEQMSRVDGEDRMLTHYTVRVPVSAHGIRVGDYGTLTAPRDAELAAVGFTVAGIDHRTTQVLRRLTCTAIIHHVEAAER